MSRDVLLALSIYLFAIFVSLRITLSILFIYLFLTARALAKSLQIHI